MYHEQISVHTVFHFAFTHHLTTETNNITISRMVISITSDTMNCLTVLILFAFVFYLCFNDIELVF